WKFDHNLLVPRAGAATIDAGISLPNITGPHLGKAPDIGANEFGLGTAWYGPRTWDQASGLVYGLPDEWHKIAAAEAPESLLVAKVEKQATVLASSDGKILAVLTLHKSGGERRWSQARSITASQAVDLTGLLEFQDGFYARLTRAGDNAVLKAARVQADGVLEVTVSVGHADLAANRLVMFQFIRSLYR
ncbi:MAG: hypothetical protein ACWGQW_22040, partial [bacterium]